MKPIYTAPNPTAARAALDELTEKWGKRYGAIVRLWESAWEEFIPFLDYDLEIRTVICSTNAIESLNARYRRSVRARGHFPTEQPYLSVKYRRIAVKRGPIKAVVVLEHSILTAVWNMLANGECYEDPGADHFTKLDPLKARNRTIRQLQTLGYEVIVTPVAA